MESILPDGLESLIPKFASEKIEPENVAELSDEVLSRLGLTTIGDRHRLHVLCANAEKQHQSAAAAALSKHMALFSRRSGSSRRGGRGGKRKLSSRRTWAVSFVCLASRHQSRIPSSTTVTRSTTATSSAE